jgi:hypothetical protein
VLEKAYPSSADVVAECGRELIAQDLTPTGQPALTASRLTWLELQRQPRVALTSRSTGFDGIMEVPVRLGATLAHR